MNIVDLVRNPSHCENLHQWRAWYSDRVGQKRSGDTVSYRPGVDQPPQHRILQLHWDTSQDRVVQAPLPWQTCAVLGQRSSCWSGQPSGIKYWKKNQFQLNIWKYLWHYSLILFDRPMIDSGDGALVWWRPTPGQWVEDLWPGDSAQLPRVTVSEWSQVTGEHDHSSVSAQIRARCGPGEKYSSLIGQWTWILISDWCRSGSVMRWD